MLRDAFVFSPLRTAKLKRSFPLFAQSCAVVSWMFGWAHLSFGSHQVPAGAQHSAQDRHSWYEVFDFPSNFCVSR